jgi:hypothetical protein
VRESGGRIDGWVCSQHEVAVLYVDRIVVHPIQEQARPRPAWVGESLPRVGAPKFARAVPACLAMRSPSWSSRATVIHGGEGSSARHTYSLTQIA